MADITDVYVRIKYKKNGKIYEDDLLEDVDMYDALSDMEYNGIYYEIDDKLIMRAYGRNYYALCFQNDSELKDYLFEISKKLFSKFGTATPVCFAPTILILCCLKPPKLSKLSLLATNLFSVQKVSLSK